MKIGYVTPKANANQAFYYQNQKQAIEDGVAGGSALAIQQLEPSRELLQLARSIQSANARGGTAFRNLAKLCSFWLGGTCTRVIDGKCPFRPCCGVFKFPELASSHPGVCTALVEELRSVGAAKAMASIPNETRLLLKEASSGNKDEAIKRRANGVDDTSSRYVAKAKASSAKAPQPPADPTVTSLWIGGLPMGTTAITEADLVDAFYSFGELRSVRVVPGCAFVEFGSRQDAETACEAKYKTLTIKGAQLVVDWARPKTDGGRSAEATASSTANLPPPGVAFGAKAPQLRPELAQALSQWPQAAPPSQQQQQQQQPEGPPNKKQRSQQPSYPSMVRSKTCLSFFLMLTLTTTQDTQRIGTNNP